VGETPLADQTSRQPDPQLEQILETLAAKAELRDVSER
jgi:hypothetical protein